KTLAASGILPSSLAGTTEIITYGILVPYKRTMIYVAIAGAIGGAMNGYLGVVGTGFALPSFLSIPVFTPIVPYMIGVFTSLIIAMVLTMVFGYGKKAMSANNNTTNETEETTAKES